MIRPIRLRGFPMSTSFIHRRSVIALAGCLLADAAWADGVSQAQASQARAVVQAA